MLLDFGASEGSDGCNFGTQEFLDSFGGREACDRKFADEKALDYTVSDVQVGGETATATADYGRGATAFEIALVGGDWKISSLCPADEQSTEKPDTESAEAAVEQTLVDYAAAEGLAPCEYLTQDCIDALGGERAACGANEPTTDVRVTKVKVRADKATATMSFEGGLGNDYELVLEDGEWRISREYFV